ncbi:hypothetical protein M011DRAFT_332160 [Sporormia fimetaria CBS 119925]|uniref:Uncharacterized protein n=1 Tax=Sporormia fimetaria CBS 119925 TaxID=1340428 RepID=A0A6A6VHM7_9PLEO|nr:hypothetical protein M011DRAFT_332160 [Sporormia fimetaria CBS 119925]
MALPLRKYTLREYAQSYFWGARENCTWLSFASPCVKDSSLYFQEDSNAWVLSAIPPPRAPLSPSAINTSLPLHSFNFLPSSPPIRANRKGTLTTSEITNNQAPSCKPLNCLAHHTHSRPSPTPRGVLASPAATSRAATSRSPTPQMMPHGTALRQPSAGGGHIMWP